MNVSRFIKLGILTIIFATIMDSFSSIHNDNFYFLGLFPIIGAFTGRVGHIIFTIASYALIPETETQFCLVVGFSVLLLVGGHLLSDSYDFLNFRILSLIYSIVIVSEGIYNQTLEGEINVFNVFVALFIFFLWNVFQSWKERRDYKNYLASKEVPATVQFVTPTNISDQKVHTKASKGPFGRKEDTNNLNFSDIIKPKQVNKPQTDIAVKNNNEIDSVNDIKPKDESIKDITIDPSNGSFEEFDQKHSTVRQWIYKQ